MSVRSRVPKPALAQFRAFARPRAAFLKADREANGVIAVEQVPEVLAELNIPWQEIDSLVHGVMAKSEDPDVLKFEDFTKWWEETGREYEEFSCKEVCTSHLNLGCQAGTVFSQDDDTVDEYDGLKVIARNCSLAPFNISIAVLATAVTALEEYSDIFDEEVIEGCQNATMIDFKLEHCDKIAAFGGPGCFESRRLRKAAGVIGTTIIFLAFFLILVTLSSIRYLVWRDQAAVFELLQYRLLVAMRRAKYILLLLILFVQVAGYGILKLWVISEHEKGNMLEGGINSACPGVQVVVASHSAAWYAFFYRFILFVLVLQAPLRDILYSIKDLYYRVSLADILRSGHPQPHRLLEGFRLVQYEEVVEFLDEFAKSQNEPRGMFQMWSTHIMSGGIQLYMKTAKIDARDGRTGIQPICARRHVKWQETMTQAYALARKSAEYPGLECGHHPNCFQRDPVPNRPNVVRRRGFSHRDKKRNVAENRTALLIVYPERGEPTGITLRDDMILDSVKGAAYLAGGARFIGRRLFKVGCIIVDTPAQAKEALAAVAPGDPIELYFRREEIVYPDPSSIPRQVIATPLRLSSGREPLTLSPPRRRRFLADYDGVPSEDLPDAECCSESSCSAEEMEAAQPRWFDSLLAHHGGNLNGGPGNRHI